MESSKGEEAETEDTAPEVRKILCFCTGSYYIFIIYFGGGINFIVPFAHSFPPLALASSLSVSLPFSPPFLLSLPPLPLFPLRSIPLSHADVFRTGEQEWRERGAEEREERDERDDGARWRSEPQSLRVVSRGGFQWGLIDDE